MAERSALHVCYSLELHTQTRTFSLRWIGVVGVMCDCDSDSAVVLVIREGEDMNSLKLLQLFFLQPLGCSTNVDNDASSCSGHVTADALPLCRVAPLISLKHFILTIRGEIYHLL